MTYVDPDTDPYDVPKWWEHRHEHINKSLCYDNTKTAPKLIIGDLVLYFWGPSVIAFFAPTKGLRICENYNRTSSLGMALNSLNRDKNIRIEHKDLLDEVTEYLREDFCF